MNHFARSDNSHTAMEKYERYVEEFSTLTKEVNDEAAINQVEFEKYDRITTRNLEIQRENYMLKHYRNQNGSLVTVAFSATSSATALDNDTTPATPTHPSPQDKSRQYKRWFNEAILEGRILKAKNEIIGKTVGDAHIIAVAESERLAAERKKILTKYGVRDIK